MKTANGPQSICGIWILISIVVGGIGAFQTAICPAAEQSGGEGLLGKDLSSEGFEFVGTIRPRHARDIEASNWSVGAETMGRDYTIYANWKKYLGPLGVKAARVQSGWAKTEKEKGKYNWAWLDSIIPDMVEQDVEPWVCLCYGNPIYPGGGGTGLGGGLPSSPEAQKAWDAFVSAFVDRYKKYVDEWEIWNEPKGGKKGAPAYGELVIRTAETVRSRQPQARIIVAAGGSFDVGFVDVLLSFLRDRKKLNLVDEVTYHPYAYNPDERYGRVAELRKTIAAYSDRITIRQGENGAPSQGGAFGALSKYDWNEERQAKWAVRRLLGDLGRDIPSSYFSICDMAYQVRKRGGDSDLRDSADDLKLHINRKGLLAINPDKTVHHVKTAYRAVQHVTAVFDSSVKRLKDDPCKVSGGAQGSTFSVFRYRTAGDRDVVTLWRDSDPPGKHPDPERVTVAIPNASLDDPVWVDMLTGRIYRIPKSSWQKEGAGCTFRNVPVYDSVILIADRSAVVTGKPDEKRPSKKQ